MSQLADLQRGVARYYAPEMGKVLENVDPKGLHRIQVSVPGIIEKAWAFPMGSMGGGAKERGAGRVPDIGADVVVQFVGGDPQGIALYMPAWWGILDDGPEVPAEVAAVPPEEAHLIASLYEDATLKVWVDQRDGKRQLAFQHKAVEECFIQVDLESGVLTLSAVAGLILKSVGLVQIEGAQVTINDRLVDSTDKAI
jgi:hypothetical protein